MDAELEAFRTRDLAHAAFPYVFLDAIYRTGWVNVRVGSRAVVSGKFSGSTFGDPEDQVFWAEFLRSLRGRGRTGVKLMASDAHLGLRAAITKVFIGVSWQRCRVHLMGNLLARVHKA
jgi:putative transposase